MALMRNVVYSRENFVFKKCCELANIPPTARQASKWRARDGKAWEAFHSMPLNKKVEFLRRVRKEELEVWKSR